MLGVNNQGVKKQNLCNFIHLLLMPKKFDINSVSSKPRLAMGRMLSFASPGCFLYSIH
jgi:hypothetical protein